MGMHPVQVIAVTGGKGGVGKTNVSVNLALAPPISVGAWCCSTPTSAANVDVLLGLTSKRTLADVIAGECDLRDVLIQGQVAFASCRQRPVPRAWCNCRPCSTQG